MRIRIADLYRCWQKSKRQAYLLSQEIEGEELADEQLRLQLEAIRMVSELPSESVQDFKIKLELLETEIRDNSNNGLDESAQIRLIDSLKNDIFLLSNRKSKSLQLV